MTPQEQEEFDKIKAKISDRIDGQDIRNIYELMEFFCKTKGIESKVHQSCNYSRILRDVINKIPEEILLPSYDLLREFTMVVSEEVSGTWYKCFGRHMGDKPLKRKSYIDLGYIDYLYNKSSLFITLDVSSTDYGSLFSLHFCLYLGAGSRFDFDSDIVLGTWNNMPPTQEPNFYLLGRNEIGCTIEQVQEALKITKANIHPET